MSTFLRIMAEVLAWALIVYALELVEGFLIHVIVTGGVLP